MPRNIMRRIVALTGYSKVGKSSIAQLLDPAQWSIKGFGDAFKADCLPFLEQMGIDPSTPEGKERARPAYVCVAELARKKDPKHWVQELERRIPPEGDIVLEDLRNTYEASWVRSMGGLVVYVHRPGVVAANRVEHETIAAVIAAYKPQSISNDEPGRIHLAVKQLHTAIDWHYRHRPLK